jgi:D-alanyl-D-alanine carboxypeptidase/D-alanyl-D-alanine-endopeptidase (penicillin-binding protein 4)
MKAITAIFKNMFIPAALFLLATAGAFAQQDALARFVAHPNLRHASVGVSIVRLADGKPVAEHNAELALTPASTLKTLTTASALRHAGSDARFVTRVGYRGDITDSTLHGDLIIAGGGDPTLGSRRDTRGETAFFRAVTAALMHAGVRRIEGRIIADDSAYPPEPVRPGWLWEDLGNYFAAGVFGLNYADNMYELVLDTSAKGRQPRVKRVHPDIPELRIHNHLLPLNARRDSAYLYGAPYGADRYLYGAVPHSKSTYTIKGDMPDPPLALASLLASYLRSMNFGVDAETTTARRLELDGKPTPAIANELLAWQSMTLGEMARLTNVYSINLFAEGMLLTLAPDASTAIARELAYWKAQGLKTDGLRIADGSGLSPVNKVTPAFLSGLMRKMQGDKAFRTSLPAAGREGTVASLLKQTRLEGKARLKSGTLGGVVCYTGYAEGATPCAVAVMVNNYAGSAAELRRAIEKLLTDVLP